MRTLGVNNRNVLSAHFARAAQGKVCHPEQNFNRGGKGRFCEFDPRFVLRSTPLDKRAITGGFLTKACS